MYHVWTDEAGYGVQVLGNRKAADELVAILRTRGRIVFMSARFEPA